MILERVYAACLTHATRPAFHIRDHSHTYSEFAQAVERIRTQLERDIGDTNNVGILAYDDLDTYAAVFAAWFAGKTIIPLGPTTPAARNLNMLAQADAQLVVSSRRDFAGLDVPGIRCVTPSRDAAPFVLRPPTERRAGDLAYILFTSGSTGVPKGVPIAHDALDAFYAAFFALGYTLDETDRCLQMFDLTFDLSLMSYCVPLTLGACVYTVPADAIKYTYIYRLLEEHQLTCALMVPSVLAHLRPFFAEIHLEKLRYSLFCGEALVDELVAEWSKCVPNARVQNVYGPTEATIFCLAYDCARDRPRKSTNGVVSIGRPMRGVEILIVDEATRDVQTGDKGELCLAGPQLTPGYWRNPAKNREAFFSRGDKVYYRTGDLCLKDADGDVQYCGRIDHQVKVQGFRVELGEIEHHVRELTGLDEVAAIAVPDAAGNMTIHLYLANFRSDAAALAAQLKQKLPPYMIPARIENLESLPLNANGKIDRPALARRVKGPLP